MVENTRSMKVNEGLFLRIFSMLEKATQGQLLIGTGNKTLNLGCLLLVYWAVARICAGVSSNALARTLSQ